MDAVIVCAGYGQRMGELTKENQKCMLPFHGRPVVEYVFNSLRSAGVDTVHLVIGFKGDQVTDYFSSSKWQDVRRRVNFIEQEPPYNYSARALLATKDYVSEEFLYSHGDIVIPSEVVKELHDKKLGAASANILLSKNPFIPETHMRAATGSNYVKRFYQSNIRYPQLMTYVGFDKHRREVFEYLPNKKFVGEALNEMLKDGKKVTSTPYSGSWVHIELPRDLDELPLELV